VVVATVYALTAAVLHAGWNLIAKRAIDPFLALWGQFLVAGLLSIPLLVAAGGLPPSGWGWATVTGLIHMPYVLGLAWAYRHGDFSLAYPVARGGGALLAAVGGVVLLGDRLGGWSSLAIGFVVAGLFTLAIGAPRRQVGAALVVAVAIGSYTTVDSHASRQLDGVAYVFAVFVMIAAVVTAWGLATGQARALASVGVDAWRRTGIAATMSLVTYGLVLLAVRRAPVGYVAALRESSVLLAAVIGWRLLGERRGWTRGAASVLVVSGLVLLVAAR
jgi:drug/metabolite transporter (DMT)-like permease